MNTQTANAPNVSVIPATKRSVQNGGQLKKQKKVRVAAYCRVSTGDECSIIIEDGYVKGEEHSLVGDAPVAQDAAQPVMQSATPTWKAGSF